MGEAAASTEASLQDLRATTESSIHELCASLDLLHGNMARIDTTQQQLWEQMGLVSTAVESSAKANDAVARQLGGAGAPDRAQRAAHGL
jgi:phage shock protein A